MTAMTARDRAEEPTQSEMLHALRELVAEADEHPGWQGHPHSETYGFRLARDIVRRAQAEPRGWRATEGGAS